MPKRQFGTFSRHAGLFVPQLLAGSSPGHHYSQAADPWWRKEGRSFNCFAFCDWLLKRWMYFSISLLGGRG